jgi:hypothetical protein
VSISKHTASPWPVRIAYLSAAIFTAASGGTNIIFGWSKGSDLPTSLVWAAVAGAVAIVFALAWPAVLKSLEAKRWSAAALSLLALVLAGTYSVTAALGSAAGGRMNAATTETATTDDRKKAQDAYDVAKAELATLKPTRTVGELEAMRAGWKRAYPREPWALEPELARAKRRAELEAKMEGATKELKTTGPAKVANSDAKALSRYMAAVGVDITPEHLTDLLVLLAVLMIEAGGGLSLAVGMALSGASASAPVAREAPASTDTGRPATLPVDALHAQVNTTLQTHPVTVFRASDVLGWLQQHGGRAETSMRRLGDALGCSSSRAHNEVRRLVNTGKITAASTPRGTLLELTPSARPN